MRGLVGAKFITERLDISILLVSGGFKIMDDRLIAIMHNLQLLEFRIMPVDASDDGLDLRRNNIEHVFEFLHGLDQR